MRAEIERSREVLFAGRIFRVEKKLVEIESGAIQERELVYHNGGSCVLAINDDQKICLVKQYRIAVEDFLYELPAGKLEAGEEPEDCARRELLEECGWETDDLRFLAKVHPTPGYCSEPINIYWTRTVREATQKLDDGEFLEVLQLPFAEAVDMALEGKITDSKTLVGILKAAALLAQETKVAHGTKE